jgi:chitinase
MDVDGAKGCLGSFMALKQEKPHLKVLLSIGGSGGCQHFATVAASAALRDNFGKSAKGLVVASGFDGIDSTSSFSAQLSHSVSSFYHL